MHLGQEHEPAGMYWFLLPGKTTMQAIEQAWKKPARMVQGLHLSNNNNYFWKSNSDTEFSTSIETPDIAHWE